MLLKYIREYRRQSHPLEEAIDKAVKRCIEEDILREFLVRYGKEARAMLFDDISVERFAEIRAEERAEEVGEQRWEEGRAKGRAEGEATMQEAIAKKMITEGMPDDMIAKLTGLSETAVNELRTTETK